jgi:cell division protein FtsB
MVGGGRARSRSGAYLRRPSEPRVRSGWRIIGAFLLLAAVVSLFSYRGARIVSLRRELLATITAQEQAIEQRAALESRLAQRSDPSVIEDEARRQLGWILPGEERVVFLPAEDASTRGGE